MNLLPQQDGWREGQPPPNSAIPPVVGDLAENEAALEGRRKANAVFVVLGEYLAAMLVKGCLAQYLIMNRCLARNSDLWPFLDSMRQMEDRFNYWAKYDYVFLNEEVNIVFWSGMGTIG